MNNEVAKLTFFKGGIVSLSVEIHFSHWAPEAIHEDALAHLAAQHSDWLESLRPVSDKSFAVNITDISFLPLLDKLLIEVCRCIQPDVNLVFTVQYKRLIEYDPIRPQRTKDFPDRT